MRFSYMYQLVLQQIQKRKVAYSFLFILIMLTVFLQICLITIVNNLGNAYFTAAGFKDKDVLIVSDGDALIKELNTQNINNVLVEKIPQDSFYLNKELGNNSINTFLYSEIMAKNSNLNIKGIDLNDAEIKDGAYPIMVPENSPIADYYYSGDTFSLYYVDPDFTVNGFIVEESFKTVDLYICALIRYPYYYYHNLSSFPNRVTRLIRSDLLNTYLLTKDIQLRDGLRLSDISRNFEEFSSVYSFVQITAEKGSEEYRSIYNMIKTKFSTVSIQDVLDNEVESLAVIFNYVIALILVSLLSVFCLTGINLYLYQIVSKEYSMYFMCGARWSYCVAIEAFRNLFVIFVPAIIGAVISCIFVVISGAGNYLNWITVLSSFIFVGLIFVVSTLYFLIKLKNTKPIDNIRLMVKE